MRLNPSGRYLGLTRRGLPLAIIGSWLALGCGKDAHAPSLQASEPDPEASLPYYEDLRDPPPNDLDWERCDWTTADGVAKGVAECATMQVPARRGVDGTTTLDIAVKRYRPTAEVRGQLWLINGGPGGPGSDFEPALDIVKEVGEGLEIYLLDHRGTGKSTFLSCPDAESPSSDVGTVITGAEWAGCAAAMESKWGQDLGGFNVTEAAKDLGEAIERTRHEAEPVFLYSVSYGTYLAQRYLQIYPNQATGIVLDSICSPGGCQLLLGFDRAFDSTARSILDLCATDATCREQLGDDPSGRLQSLGAKLENGHCSELGWNRPALRHLLGFMVMYVGLRDYIPSVVARVDRCSENDVQSLKHFQTLLNSLGQDSAGFSQVVSANIALSEMSERPLPTAAEIDANVAGLSASTDAGPRMSGAVSTWPLYPLDEYVGQFATTSTPLLMLNGTLDPQTPLAVASPTGTHYAAAHQTFVPIPYAAHTTLTQSPVDADGHTCGAELILQFFTNPTAAIDASCTDFVLAPDFFGTKELTSALYGTTTPYADEVPKYPAQAGYRRLERVLGTLPQGHARRLSTLR